MNKDQIKGAIVDIERFRFDVDGPGMVSLVAMHGCRLGCTYCVNTRCKDLSIRKEAYSGQVAETLMKDALYYLATGGGVVFGGGEPLGQTSFIREVCEQLDKNINIRIETSLNVLWEKVESLIDIVDLWIIDIKDINPQIYKEYTGLDNSNVLANLDKLIGIVGKKKVHIRIPYIKHYNNEVDVKASTEYIKSKYGIEPEVFEYMTDIVDIPKLIRNNIESMGNCHNVSFQEINRYQNNLNINSDNNSEWLLATYKGLIMADWLYEKCGIEEQIKSVAELLERYSLEEIAHMDWYQGKATNRKRFLGILNSHPELAYVTVDEIENSEGKNEIIDIDNPVEKLVIPKNELANKAIMTEWDSSISYISVDGYKYIKIIKNEKDFSGDMVRDYYLKKSLRIINDIFKTTMFDDMEWNIEIIDDKTTQLIKQEDGPEKLVFNISNSMNQRFK